MSAKNLDNHNRWRSKTIAFRVSPEENEQIEIAVRLSGLTKQDYITRRLLEKERYFQRKSFRLAHPCCVVCGADRISLLKAVPYGEKGTAERGLLFCPTHGTLFAAHLISYNSKGELLVSGRLSEEERALFHLTAGEKAHGSFVRRRMAEHRKVFNREGGKRK